MINGIVCVCVGGGGVGGKKQLSGIMLQFRLVERKKKITPHSSADLNFGKIHKKPHLRT